jgi:hypothetical protein
MNQRYIEALALDLGAKPQAVAAWRYRGNGVPHKWRLRLLRAAAGNGVHIPDTVFDHFTPVRESTPRGKRPSRAKAGTVVSAG